MLDKPNAHRATELCVHTIPIFGYARNCSEMVLKSVYRSFKDWPETNTHPDAHLSSVELAFARDWQGRIYSLHMCWVHGSENERRCAESGLLRFFLGEK